MKTILYIHGMGGGTDSRIPAILSDWFAANRPGEVSVIVRTYDFNPDRGAAMIRSWYEELRPAVVIGESLGGVHALALLARCSAGSSAAAFPLLLVSPALNAPLYFQRLGFLSRVRCLHKALNRHFRPKEGDRQALDFSYENLRAWAPHRSDALSAARLTALSSGQEAIHAFFGRHDHYRRTGVVSIREWRRRFGVRTCTLYDGSHYMEEEHLKALLIPAILERL